MAASNNRATKVERMRTGRSKYISTKYLRCNSNESYVGHAFVCGGATVLLHRFSFASTFGVLQSFQICDPMLIGSIVCRISLSARCMMASPNSSWV